MKRDLRKRMRAKFSEVRAAAIAVRERQREPDDLLQEAGLRTNGWIFDAAWGNADMGFHEALGLDVRGN